MRFVFRHVGEEPRGVVSQHRCVACTAYARVTHADLPMRARCFFSFFFFASHLVKREMGGSVVVEIVFLLSSSPSSHANPPDPTRLVTRLPQVDRRCR